MKRISVITALVLAGSLLFAQQGNQNKNQSNTTGQEKQGNQENQKQGASQDTLKKKEVGGINITPGASGVKRSIAYRFSNVTGDSDPGNGIFRFNNQNPSSTNYLIVDNIDFKGEDQNNWYSTWEKNTGASGRGRITLVEYEGTNIIVFDVTGVFIKAEGYWKLPVQFISGTVPAANALFVYVFDRIAHDKTPATPPVTQPEPQVTPPVTPPVTQPEPPVTPPVTQPEPSVTPPVTQPEPQITPPVTPPVTQPEPQVTPPVTPPVTQPEPQVTPPVTPPVTQPEPPVTPPVIQPEPQVTPPVTPPVTQPEPQVTPPVSPPVTQPEPPVSPPVTQPEPPVSPPVTQPEPPVSPPVIQPEPPVQVTEEIKTGKDLPPKPTRDQKLAMVDQKQQDKKIPLPVQEDTDSKPAKPPVPVTETKPVINEVPTPPVVNTAPVTDPGQPGRTVAEKQGSSEPKQKPVQTTQETQTNPQPQQPQVNPPVQQTTKPGETKQTQQTQQTQQPKQGETRQETTVSQGNQTYAVNQGTQTNPNSPWTVYSQQPQSQPPVQQPGQKQQTAPVTQVNKVPEQGNRQPARETAVTRPKETIPLDQDTQNIPGSKVNNYFTQTYTGAASADAVTYGKWYRGIIELGYGLGVSEYGMNNFRFNFINSLRISNKTYIGLGIGIRKFYEDNSVWYPVSSKTNLPVFFDLHHTFRAKRCTPYFALGFGGSASIESGQSKTEGIFFSPSAGMWLWLSKRTALFGGIAYELEGLEYANFSDNIPFKENSHSISLNIGIAF
jgi:hypothetical protein